MCNSDDLMSSLVNFEISSVLNNKSCKISAYKVNQLNIPDNKIKVSNLKKMSVSQGYQLSYLTKLRGHPAYWNQS